MSIQLQKRSLAMGEMLCSGPFITIAVLKFMSTGYTLGASGWHFVHEALRREEYELLRGLTSEEALARLDGLKQRIDRLRTLTPLQLSALLKYFGISQITQAALNAAYQAKVEELLKPTNPENKPVLKMVRTDFEENWKMRLGLEEAYNALMNHTKSLDLAPDEQEDGLDDESSSSSSDEEGDEEDEDLDESEAEYISDQPGRCQLDDILIILNSWRQSALVRTVCGMGNFGLFKRITDGHGPNARITGFLRSRILPDLEDAPPESMERYRLIPIPLDESALEEQLFTLHEPSTLELCIRVSHPSEGGEGGEDDKKTITKRKIRKIIPFSVGSYTVDAVAFKLKTWIEYNVKRGYFHAKSGVEITAWEGDMAERIPLDVRLQTGQLDDFIVFDGEVPDSLNLMSSCVIQINLHQIQIPAKSTLEMLNAQLKADHVELRLKGGIIQVRPSKPLPFNIVITPGQGASTIGLYRPITLPGRKMAWASLQQPPEM